jgi:hypothetical protein
MMKQNATVQRSRSYRRLLFLVAVGAWLGGSPHAFGAIDPRPCSLSPESKQLDYWLGDWTISGPGTAANAVSKVYLTLDKCMLVESWDGGRGHKGENMFAYSSDDKSWHGMFADNQGRVHVFQGKVSGDSAEFLGSSRGPDGETNLNRIRIARISPDKVEQVWEKSSDNGATWKTEFRGEYQRKKS